MSARTDRFRLESGDGSRQSDSVAPQAALLQNRAMVEHADIDLNVIATTLRVRADECVMCGLCLPHCPTFQLSGLETRSPRGRIALAKSLQPGATVDASLREALESCLQCRACEAACPAQVRYGEIIEGARAILVSAARSRDESAATPGPGEPATLPSGVSTGARLAGLATRHPMAAAHALGLLGAIARALPQWTHRLGRRTRWLLRARAPLAAPATADAALLFTGCVARSFEADAQRALLAIAAVCALPLAPAAAGCCGAFARHLGDIDTARSRARANRNALGAARLVVALDSGCIGALRESGVAVVEACRWLLAHQEAWRTRLRRVEARIGVFVPCTHRNVLRDPGAASELLTLLPGVECVPITAGHGCCGAAGPQLFAHPRQADALAATLVDAIMAARLDALATTNVGCSLHLFERLRLRGINLTVAHPVACLAQRLLPRPPA